MEERLERCSPMPRNAKDRQSAATRSYERGWNRFPPEILPNSANASISGAGLQSCGRTHFCCLKPPGLRYFVTQPLETNIHGLVLKKSSAFVE